MEDKAVHAQGPRHWGQRNRNRCYKLQSRTRGGPLCVSFLITNKMPQITNIYKEKAYLGLEFRRFQSMINWPHCFWVCDEAAPYGSSVRWGSTAHLIIRKQKRGRGRDWGPTILFKGMPPMTSGSPTWPHLLQVPPPPNTTSLGTKLHGSLEGI
jgi:hypothetical protein